MLHKGGARAPANRQGLTVDLFMAGSGHGGGAPKMVGHQE